MDVLKLMKYNKGWKSAVFTAQFSPKYKIKVISSHPNDSLSVLTHYGSIAILRGPREILCNENL